MNWSDQTGHRKPLPGLKLGRSGQQLWRTEEQVRPSEEGVKKTRRLKFVRVHRQVKEDA